MDDYAIQLAVLGENVEQLKEFVLEQRAQNGITQEMLTVMRAEVAVLKKMSGIYGSIGGAVTMASGLLAYLASQFLAA